MGILLSKTLSYAVLNFDFEFNCMYSVLDVGFLMFIYQILLERESVFVEFSKFFCNTKNNTVFGGILIL